MLLASWLFTILTAAGFFLALILILHVMRQRRPPSSIVAWLLAIVLIPYAGVPLYLMFGGRKMKRMAARKDPLRGNGRCDPSPSCIPTAFPPVIDNLFPQRDGNGISLLTTGEEAFQHLAAVLGQARESICITSFILGDDPTGLAILAILVRKATSGVRVNLLLDAVGSRGISKGALHQLRAAGGKAAFFMPLLHVPFRGRANLRNHRKMVIVDGRVALAGGMNLASEYMGSDTRPDRWHDLSVELTGPVVGDLAIVFREDWRFATGEESATPDTPPSLPTIPDGHAIQLVPSGPDTAGDPLFDALLSTIYAARERIWIVTPYFIPDDMLIKALSIAARRAVDVRIILPRVSNHRLADMVGHNYLREIQEAGARVFSFLPGMMHGKLIIVDTDLAVVGSMNMDIRSFFLNYEIALFIHGGEIVRNLEPWVENLMRQSDEGIRPATVVGDYMGSLARLLAPLL